MRALLSSAILVSAVIFCGADLHAFNPTPTNSCARPFAELDTHIKFMSVAVPAQYRKAIADAAEKHYGLMAKNMTSEQRNEFASIISNSRIVDDLPKNIGGNVTTQNGKQTLNIALSAYDSPFALLTSIHEAQHVADGIAPSLPAKLRARLAPTKTDETRAILREHAMLSDIVSKIGVEGVADILMQAHRIPSDQRKAAEDTVRWIMLSKATTVQSALENTIIGAETIDLEAVRTFGRNFPQIPWTQLQTLADRKTYLNTRMKPYAETIEQERATQAAALALTAATLTTVVFMQGQAP